MAKGRGSVGGAFGEQRRRSPRIGVALFVLSTLFFGINFAQEWWVSHGVRQEYVQRTQEIAQTRAHIATLQRASAYYASKSYITRRAREIGMARPNDTLLVFVPGTPTVRVVHVTRPAPQRENILARLLHAIFQ